MELNKLSVKRIKGLILFAVVAAIVGVNYRVVLRLLGAAVTIFTPFLAGATIAFVLNVPMRAIERILPRGIKKHPKLSRALSLICALLLVMGCLLLLFLIVIPELVETLSELQDGIPAFFAGLRVKLQNLFAAQPEIVSQLDRIDWKNLIADGVGFLTRGAGSVITSAFSLVVSVVGGAFTVSIAVIFALYLLLQKETLARQFRRLFSAFLPKKVDDDLISLLTFTEKTFSRFISGQGLEALILGCMFALALTIFRMPYAILIGAVVTFTALIPIFGSFVGCFTGAFFILTVNPRQAIYFIILFVLLQQVEGNLIYPHVVGKSVGLPPIWVLVAVSVGGSLFGVLGMLAFIPLCSVLYAIVRRVVHNRLAARAGEGTADVPASERDPAKD